jgi:radical SAM family uncharacterized protein/radical SAM-linked protein
MTISDEKWFSRIERPSRYIGNEINAIRKDPGAIEVSLALAFPDVYEVGMSHFGIKILYQLLNTEPWIAAERVFCPWIDLEKEMRKRGFALETLESGRPLKGFDIIGFSLQHELSYTNVLTMLHLAGIPFLSKDREPLFPMIIAGGPACFNPEPVAALFDVFVIGDGERTTLEICTAIRDAKKEGIRDKIELLDRLDPIDGVYVPAFYKTSYHRNGTVHRTKRERPGKKTIRKAAVPDIDRYPFPVTQPVPHRELIHDRLTFEISRGCTRGCRFCQAGMIYRPVRERPPQSILNQTKIALERTGFEELSLLSLSSGDYSCIGYLIKKLMDDLADDKVAVSLPSLRVDSLNSQWLDDIKRVRKTGFTLAPEAGNDRLRRVINKSLTDHDILDMTAKVYGAGWALIKLYFMIGLPTEEEEDLADLAQLCKALVRQNKSAKTNLNVSISTFVPKPHTPFMWARQIDLEESRRRIAFVQQALKSSKIRVKWNQPEMSWIEGIFSRGDRRLSHALIQAWIDGARFDAWGDQFNMAVWRAAFKKTALDPAFYLYRHRPIEEVFPWEHIDSGVKKKYLLKEWNLAMEETATPDCREGCHECGVCDHRSLDPVLYRKQIPSEVPEGKFSGKHSIHPVIKKYRLVFTKTAEARYFSHLEMVRIFTRALKRAKIPMLYSRGFHPLPKIRFAAALPVGIESLHETLDLDVLGDVSLDNISSGLNTQLPKGFEITDAYEIGHAGKPARIKESHYEIIFNGLQIRVEALKAFLASEAFPISKKGKKGVQIVDSRHLVQEMNLLDEGKLHLVVQHESGPMLKPADIVRAVFNLSDSDMEALQVLKTRQVLCP